MSEELSAKFLKQAFQLQEGKYYKQAIEALYKALCIDVDNIEIMFQISHLYFLMNNHERALEYAEKILDINPEHLDTLKILVKINKFKKKYSNAVVYSEKLYRLSPDVSNFVLYLEMLLECEQYNTILSEIESSQFHYDDKKNEKLLFISGYTQFKLNQLFKAITTFQELIKLYPNNNDAKFYLGVIYYQKHQETDAEKLFLSILDDIQCDRTYNYLGIIKLDQQKIGEAINYFQFAIKIEPSVAFYYYNLATAYSLNGWFSEAEDCFKKAIMLAPENLIYNYSLAYLYYERDELKKCRDCLSTIFAIDAKYLDALILRSMIDAKEGKLVEAKKNLEQYKETETNNDFLYYALAKIYKSLELYKDAIDAMQQALFVKPQSLEYLTELADCYCEVEKYQVAQDIISKVLYLNNRFIYAHLLNVKINLFQKNYQAALKLIQNILKLDNSSAEAYKYKSIIYSAQGLKQRAIESAKIAVTLRPHDHSYYAHLAKLYYDAEEFSDAFLYYKEASIIDEMNSEYLYLAAKSADKANDFANANNYYSYALRLQPFNNLIIYEYVDFLCNNGRLKQALKFLKNKISLVDSENVSNLLIQKYEELKSYRKPNFLVKFSHLFKR